MKVRQLAALATALSIAIVAPASAQDPPVSGDIVGGVVVPTGDLPWTVALVDPSAADPLEGQFCTGTLIGPTVVLTAHHCAVGLLPSEIDVASAPEQLSLPIGVDPLVGTELRDVTEIRVHPAGENIASGGSRWDLALLTLDSAFTGPPTRPEGAVPLPNIVVPGADDAIWDVEEDLVVAGFGVYAVDSGSSDYLRAAVVQRIADSGPDPTNGSGCGEDDVYGTDFEDTNMVCAAVAFGGADTCQGDSGGPLIAPADGLLDTELADDPADWKLAAVTSWGFGCGVEFFPGVYGRLGSDATPPVGSYDMNGFANSLIDAPDVIPAPPEQPQGTGAGPTVSDTTPEVGQFLTCQGADAGDFTPAATEPLEIVWQIADSPDAAFGFDIDIGSTYHVIDLDIDGFLRCVVRGRVAGAGGYGEVRSDFTDAVVAPADEPIVIEVPVDRPVQVPSPRDSDLANPRVGSVRSSCQRRARRCTLRFSVSDADPSSGIAVVLATVRNKRGFSKSLRAKKQDDGSFVLRTPRLKPGRYTVELLAIDRAGNVQATATKKKLRLRALAR